MGRFVEVAALPHNVAMVAKGALEAEGLVVVLDQPALGAVYGLQHGPWVTKVLVPPDDADAALALLAEIEAEDA